MKGARFLILVLVLLALASVPTTAAPLSDPCPPGTAYHPACDVDQNNQINILDIQRTASRFNQSGTWVSDNNHTHLGQEWTGMGTNNSLKLTGSFGHPNYAPLTLSNSAGVGLLVDSASQDGIWMYPVGGDGVHVMGADEDGVWVYSAGYAGLRVVNADINGVSIHYAGEDGVLIHSSADDGVQIGKDNGYPTYGLFIPSPGTPYEALWPNTANAAGEWALYTVDRIEAANVFLSAQTLVAAVGGDQPLSPGDVVTAIGLADPIPGALNRLAVMTLASAERANVVGVVSSRMALQPAPGKEGEHVMHSTDGPAQPGDYVAITVLGVAQVKVQDGEAIQLGQRLTVAGTPGHVRALRMVQVEGISVDESGPVLGVALTAVEDGMVWVLVSP